MLLLNIALAICSFNQIAVDYGRTPVTRAGINGTRVKQNTHSKSALKYADYKFNFTKEITPEHIYNVHLFLEKDFQLEKQSFVRAIDKKEGKYIYYSNFESEYDEASLASLYFDTLINKNYTVVPGSDLAVSSRDYFAKEQSESLCRIFGALGYKVKAIPESLAACTQNVEFCAKDTAKKNYYINFKGAKVVGSLYEIKNENDVISITLLDSKELDLKSDVAIENDTADLIMNELRIRNDISFLPYEPSEKPLYSNIQGTVFEYLRDIQSTLPEFDVLEVNYFDKATNLKNGSISYKKISFDKMRDEIRSAMQLEALVADLPEDVEKFIITDIPYRSNFSRGFTLVNLEFVVKGLLAAHDKKFKLVDSRVIFKTQGEFSPMYMITKAEIDLKTEVHNVIVPTISKSIEEYKYISNEEKTKLLALLTEENTKTVKGCREIRTMWESIQKLNTKREADSICRNDDISTLEKSLEEAKKLLDTLEADSYKEFSDLYEETSKWLQTAKEDPKSTGFIPKSNRLRAYIGFITNTLKKAEEKRIADEAKAKEDEAKALAKDELEAAKEEEIREVKEEAAENLKEEPETKKEQLDDNKIDDKEKFDFL